MKRKHLIISLGSAAALLVAGGIWWARSGSHPETEGSPASTAPTSQPGEISAVQIEKLGITTVAGEATYDVTLGAVPATVTLPPESRVAVTAPFTGYVVRLFVVTGQAVRRGQPLAAVISREPVQYGAELARARARLDLAQKAAARTSQLAREGIIAGSRADEAQATLRQAQVDVGEYNRVLNLSGANANGEITLRSPIAGRLAQVNVQTGGAVDGLTTPFVVEDTSVLMLDMQLPERLANRVFPGMAVEVPVPDAAPVTGRIVSVSGTIDQATRSILAKARIDNSHALLSGKTVMALIKTTTQTPGTSTPAAAVTRMGDKDVVFVRTDEGFERRIVTVASRTADRIVLSSGLKPGERVATSGISELKVVLGGD